MVKGKRFFQSRCRQCVNEVNKTRAKGQVDAKTKKTWRLKYRFGMTYDAYYKLLTDQNKKCAICGSEQCDNQGRELCVDHCHTTGKIRGLLCKWCNLALGNFRDSTENLKNAIEYLEKHG